MKFNKDMVGKLIYGLPYGNEVRRRTYSEEQRIVTFMVKSVGRVYVDLAFVEEKDGVLREYCRDKYHQEIGSTQSMVNSGYSGNGGYYFYASLEDVNTHFRTLDLRKEVSQLLTDSNYSIRGLTLSQLERIKAIAEEVTDEE